MADAVNTQMQLGLTELSRRLNSARLQIFEHKRPWPNRRATHFVVGKSDRRTDLVLTDEIRCRSAEHQAAVDSYVRSECTDVH